MAVLTSDPLALAIAIAAFLAFIVAMTALLIPSIKGVGDLSQLVRVFSGYEVPPAIVALARRLATGAFAGLLTWACRATGVVEEPESLLKLAGAIMGMVEVFGWGLLDQLTKPGQNADNPKPHAGGNPPGAP